MPEAQESATTPQPGLSPLALRAILAAPFLLIPTILVFSAVGSGQFLYGVDLIGGFYALRGAVASALAEGRLPLWEPRLMAGFPLFAAPHSAVLYPPNWLVLVLPVGAFWSLSVVLHLALAGIFAREWLRKGLGLGIAGAMAGGLLFMMSGFIVSHVHAGHTNHVWAYPWVPALLWRLERFLASPTLRRGLLLSLVLAMLFLAGIPPYVFYAGLIVLARLVQVVLSSREGRRERLLRSIQGIGWLALGLLFCAPQLLPTLELITQGQRVSIKNYEFVTSFSVAPINYIGLLAPTFFGDGREAAIWSHGFLAESHGFVGIAGLVLAGVGLLGRHPQRFLWAGIAVAGALLALGQYTPIFRAFYAVVPVAGLFRVPARYLLLYAVALAALAAMGMDLLRVQDGAPRRPMRVLAAAVAVVALLAAGLRFSLTATDGPSPGWWTSLVESERQAFRAEQGSEAPAASRSMAARSLLWAALCAGVATAGLLVRGTVGASALGLLLVGELWVYGSRYFVGYPVEEMVWPKEFIENVRSNPNYPFRIATVAMSQTPEIGKCELAGLDHVGGFDPMMLRRYTTLINVGRGKPATDLVVTMAYSRPGPVFDLLGARYWIVPGPRQEPPGWRTIGQLPSGFIYENPAALPRAFLVGHALTLTAEEERLRYLASPEFDGSQVVVLEEGEGESGSRDPVRGSIQLQSQEAGGYRLRAECDRDAWLVLTEAWYPGWSVEIDGHPAGLLRADHLLQAVRLGAGKHEVQFRYRSRTLATGFVIAAIAAVGCAGFMTWRRRSSSGEGQSPGAG
jgi:hypothetical protein